MAPRKGPRRRYYRLTAQGHAALRASVEEWQAFSQAVQRVLREGAVDPASNA
jgi:DNA-binding PadR family transcriptional regulator